MAQSSPDGIACLSLSPSYLTDTETGAPNLSHAYSPKWHWKLRTDEFLRWEGKRLWKGGDAAHIYKSSECL